MTNVKTCILTAAGTIVTPEGRLSYPHLFKPNPKAKTQDGRLKYTGSILLPPDSDLMLLRNAANDAVIAEWGSEKSKRPKNIKAPFLDAYEKSEDEQFKGWTLLRVSTLQQPQVVNGAGLPVSDPSDAYAGRWVRFSVRAGTYTTDTNSGVSFFLSNVQLLRDDEPLAGGKVQAQDEFVPIEGVSGGGTADDVFS